MSAAFLTDDFSKLTRSSACSPVSVHGPRIGPEHVNLRPVNSLTARPSDAHRIKETCKREGGR